MTREAAQRIRNAIEAKLAELGKELGVTFTLGNARYNPVDGSGHFVRLDYLPMVKPGAAPVETREAKDFKLNAKRWGLEPEDFGKTFRFRDSIIKIIGAKPLSTVFPILGLNISTGSVMKYMARDIVRQLRPENIDKCPAPVRQRSHRDWGDSEFA